MSFPARIVLTVLALVPCAWPCLAADSHGDMADHASHGQAMEAAPDLGEYMAQDAAAGSAMDHAMEQGDMQHGDMPNGEAGHAAMGNDADMGDMQHGDMDGVLHGDTQHGDMTATMPEGHDHEAMMKKAEEEAEPDDVQPGVDEHLGEYIADAEFKDSEGNTVRLRELASHAPTLILPVYYTCPSVCNLLQSAFVRVLPKVALEPGKELQVVSLSFDEHDDVAIAAKSKHNFAHALRDEFPPEHWHFLVGDKHNIDLAMDSVGFRFRRIGKDFAHPVAVIALAPDGKIVRYLYGLDFLPFDVTMAATEAAQGKVGMSVKRLLSFCFNYDPKGRRYTFDLMRVAGVGILGFAGIFLAALLLAGRKKKRK